MDPQPSNGAFPPPPQGDPYAFITGAPPKPARPSPMAKMTNGNSTVGRLVLIIGGAIALIIVATIVVNVVFGSKTNFTPLIGLAQTQQEIARVTKQGSSSISDQSVAGAAINTRLSIITQQHDLLTYLSGQKQKIADKDLGLKKDGTTDKQLSQAKSTSTFDLVFTQILRQQLTDYATELNTAYKNAPGDQARKLLAADYEQAQMLLKQWPEE